jgi:glycosyltransferase involved in cell wall biosynthesis
MAKVVFIGAHLGFPTALPLGGGAVVGDRLVREWAPLLQEELLVLGAGPRPPADGIRYARIGRLQNGDFDPTRLSVGGYARFCEAFSQQALAALEAEGRPAAVYLNDISEAPQVETVGALAARVISLWHVDVADYFGRIALRSERAALWGPRVYEALRRWGWTRVFPRVLRLVFERQRGAVLHADRLVLPSAGMAERLMRSYGPIAGEDLRRRIRVLPWGAWEEGISEAEIDSERKSHRRAYDLRPETLSLVTVSRLSPEKGIDLLLSALAILERERAEFPKDVRLFICGAPAFMWGEAYARRLRAQAARLGSIRVHFLGHVEEPRKTALLRSSDLFVSPSLHESYGLSIQEALGAGLPVLCSDSLGAHEILPDGCGVLVRYGDRRRAPRALADALRRLMEDPAELATLRQGVRERKGMRRFSETARDLLDLASDGPPGA